MNAKNITIDREAHDKAKGFRFQRLRAVSLMLKAMTENETAYIYCAIENIGDVHMRTSSSAESANYIEEDKDYSEGSGFSFNSIQVLKTLVNFIDAWHKFELSSTLYFGFCTTAVISKEKSSNRSKRLEIEFPDRALLEFLNGNDPMNDEVINIIKAIIIDAYKEIYSKHEKKGHLDSIINWSNSTWREFLERIRWFFGDGNETELETELRGTLKKCPFYNNRIQGKEGHVISILVDEFDKKQNLDDFADRFVHSSDIKLVVKRVESGEYRISDPAWKMWKNLPPPVDNRNLIDKVRSVSTTFNEEMLDSWCRSVALSRYEQDSLKHDKSILSLRYRVFESCHEKLISIVQNGNIGQEKLQRCVENLVLCAYTHIKTLSEDYKYPLINQSTIRGIILELVDSCFLSFEKKGEIN